MLIEFSGNKRWMSRTGNGQLMEAETHLDHTSFAAFTTSADWTVGAFGSCNFSAILKEGLREKFCETDCFQSQTCAANENPNREKSPGSIHSVSKPLISTSSVQGTQVFYCKK